MHIICKCKNATADANWGSKDLRERAALEHVCDADIERSEMLRCILAPGGDTIFYIAASSRHPTATTQHLIGQRKWTQGFASMHQQPHHSEKASLDKSSPVYDVKL